MKTRNLSSAELEMLGLQSGTITTNVTKVKDNQELEHLVGAWVVVDGHEGMIDKVHGNMLGFVWANKDSWTSELVKEDDIVSCLSDASIRKAKASAKCYFNREETSLRQRIRMKYKMDNESELKAQLAYIADWNKRI